MPKRRRKSHRGLHTGAVSLVSLLDKNSSIAEQYRTIRTNIQFATSADREMKTIVITSADYREGKSTTAANLAVVYANAGGKTLLIDANMREATMNRTFGLNNTIGLSTVLSTQKMVVESVQDPNIPNLTVLTSGTIPPNPSELLDSRRLDQVLSETRNLYDIVIFDTPPVISVTDARIIASKADGTILVARENITDKEALAKSKQLLKSVKANLLGVVYNGMTRDTSQDYYSV